MPPTYVASRDPLESNKYAAQQVDPAVHVSVHPLVVHAIDLAFPTTLPDADVTFSPNIEVDNPFDAVTVKVAL